MVAPFWRYVGPLGARAGTGWAGGVTRSAKNSHPDDHPEMCVAKRCSKQIPYVYLIYTLILRIIACILHLSLAVARQTARALKFFDIFFISVSLEIPFRHH